MSGESSIESSMFAGVCAALDDRLRAVLDRLEGLEARLATLEPDEEGLTYKQAARLLGASAKPIGRWVDAGKMAVGGGTPRSPRILRSEVRRIPKLSLPLTEHRTRIIGLRLRDADRRRFAQMARSAGVGVSTYARLIIEQYVQTHGRKIASAHFNSPESSPRRSTVKARPRARRGAATT